MKQILSVALVMSIALLVVGASYLTYVARRTPSIIAPENDLRSRIGHLAYEVTKNGATEPPFQNEYWDEKRAWIYVDVIDGTPLFTSLDKYDSGTGWPSFVRPISSWSVTEHADTKLFTPRTEIRSTSSDAHLGHVFDDGPVDRGGKRYCMNSAALRFVPVEDLEKEGYGEYQKLFTQ